MSGVFSRSLREALLDENLSSTLTEILSEIYPQTSHVREFGLQSAPDPKVWVYAADHSYTIATKDGDFHHRSLLHGYPPKVIWIQLGNCLTHKVAELLVVRREQVETFVRSPEQSFLVLA